MDHYNVSCIHKSPSAPSVSELRAFDKLFDGNLTASNIEAMDVLFSAVGKGSFRQPRRPGHLLGRTATSVLVVFLRNIETRYRIGIGCFFM
jgi:hypothetical protein